MIFTPFEPKVAFRYTLSIDGIPGFICKASDMPSVDQGEIIIDYINTDFKVKGKSRWQDINVTLYDPVTPSGAAAVHAWLNVHHNSTSGIDGFAFDEYKKDITLEALDPHGTPVEVWTLYGAFMSTINWGSMDWANDESKQIELGIKFDYAVLG